MKRKPSPKMKTPPSILVVDDVPENLQVVGNLLKNHSYEVRLATGGEQAIESVLNDPPDLLLLDISMPGIDGFEVCRRLKSDRKAQSIPVIFLTAAHVSQDQMRKGFEVGAVDYIAKPVDDRVLLARVQTHIALKRSKELLEQQNHDLKEANDAKNKLFSIMGHDLKNVFSGLNTLIDLMLKDYDGIERDEKIHYLTEMRKASQQTLTVLDDILQWSRLERGLITPNIREIDLAPIMDDALDIVRPQAEQKGITLEMEWSELPVVRADAEMMHAVLRNLLTNAVKFTRRNGTVTLTAKTADAKLQISVTDTGVGIPASKVPHLFRSTSGAEMGTNGEVGTGLGLMICRELIEKHDGRIWVESQLGKGSSFHVSVPIRVGKSSQRRTAK
jgi:signal transduction histidine kinase